MTKLSDIQAILLSAAAQRADGNLLPLPGSLRGGAAAKVVAALLARGLIREDLTDSRARADAALNTLWRNDDDGRGVVLRITSEGLVAIGVEPEPTEQIHTQVPASEPVAYAADTNSAGEPAALKADTAPAEGRAKRSRPKAMAPTNSEPASPRKARNHTKQAQLIAMLRGKEGATIAQIVEATGWQPHTVRGAFAGALKKRLGLTVTSEKVGGVRVYRLSR